MATKANTVDWGGLTVILDQIKIAAKPGLSGASSTETISAAELIYLDAITAGTAIASHAMITDSNNDIAGVRKMSLRGPVGTGATGAGLLTLQTAELTVVAADHIGRIDFQAPLETGADAILVVAAISARANATFDATTNTTEFVFSVSAGDAVVDTLRLTATALQSETNDLVALGTTSLGFSDLHLATGGTINFANGEMLITETANNLAVTGGDISMAGGILTGVGRETVADGATIILTAAQSGSVIDMDSGATADFTLPTAVIGLRYTFVFSANSATDSLIDCASADFFVGSLIQHDTDTAASEIVTTADGSADDRMTFAAANGGLAGSWFELLAISDTQWLVWGHLMHSGTVGDIFSAP